MFLSSTGIRGAWQASSLSHRDLFGSDSLVLDIYFWLICSQVAIEKFDDHVQRILGLRNIRVVKESVKESLPNMKLGLNS